MIRYVCILQGDILKNLDIIIKFAIVNSFLKNGFNSVI